MATVVQRYSPAQAEPAIALLAEAFVSSPLHVSAFGPNRIDLNRLFFRIGLRHMFSGQAFVALRDGELQGYMHFNASPFCLPLPEEVPIAAATILKPLGQALPRIIPWFSRWCRLDPAEPHVHLGPIGVLPQAQRRGIGSALMRRYIDHLEHERAAAYLETDRLENVEFYEKYGFAVQRHERVIGAPVWYMWRPADR
ncbi:MAG TPA: GNAT family N-acetyltransferase [Candidatus Eisenbacteria bacterium]|nr:GNAT family N-acetyltransferase [Candidatus Eisenbacteria bacterium]